MKQIRGKTLHSTLSGASHTTIQPQPDAWGVLHLLILSNEQLLWRCPGSSEEGQHRATTDHY